VQEVTHGVSLKKLKVFDKLLRDTAC
jgi:hypothetical protein